MLVMADERKNEAAVQLGKLRWEKATPQQKRELIELIKAVQPLSVAIRMKKTTPKQRSAHARMMAEARWRKSRD